MGYEIFDGTEYRYGSTALPTVKLRSDGVLRFNVAAARALRKLGAERALVLWDKVNHKIAFSAAPPEHKTSFKVMYNQKGNSAQITARTLPRLVGLAPGAAALNIFLEVNQELLEGETAGRS